MAKPRYVYDIDDLPPVRFAILYGLQWAVIMFPALIIVSTLSGKALGLSSVQEVSFLQLILLTSGAFTALQSLWGHRYPLLDGPATALLLTFIVLAPYGLGNIQGGMIFGGALLILLVLVGKLGKVIAYATPNVVGVILMLISFSLLPHLIRSLAGIDGEHPQGQNTVFFLSLTLVILMAALSYWLKGVWKTLALLFGMLLGTAVFYLFRPPDLRSLLGAGWVATPGGWMAGRPTFYWPAVLAFASSYVAVLVNSLGSLHGIANVTDAERLPRAIHRGMLLNGLGGICCGLLGIIGTVSYSMSPGVILANRVASRFTITYCGVILIVAAFVPKLAALLALVPSPVVGAALCVAMGAQVGVGLAVTSAGGLTSRDYFVVGLPVLLGTMMGFLPDPFMTALPVPLRVFLGNGLIVGIFVVLLLEHVLMPKKADGG